MGLYDAGEDCSENSYEGKNGSYQSESDITDNENG